MSIRRSQAGAAKFLYKGKHNKMQKAWKVDKEAAPSEGANEKRWQRTQPREEIDCQFIGVPRHEVLIFLYMHLYE